MLHRTNWRSSPPPTKKTQPGVPRHRTSNRNCMGPLPTRSVTQLANTVGEIMVLPPPDECVGEPWSAITHRKNTDDGGHHGAMICESVLPAW